LRVNVGLPASFSLGKRRTIRDGPVKLH
jgi:hypothetical protein